MSYEESKLFSLLKKQDIDSLFLEATNYLCQTKSLFEEKERLQQENKQLKEKLDCDLQWSFKYEKQVDNWNKLKKFLEEWKENEEYCYLASSPIDRCRKDIYGEILDKMKELEGSDSNE